MRLFNNSKAVGENIRGFKQISLGETYEKEYAVRLNEGKNELSAVGISYDGIESNPVTVTITYRSSVEMYPDMYILAIGINEYRNKNYNLNYCVDDATGFVNSIMPKAKKLFTNVNS